MHLFNTVLFTFCLTVGVSVAELYWDYGNWSPMIGPCATCFPNTKSVESRSNFHSSFGESARDSRQVQFVQAQPAHVTQQAEDADNSVDTVQLVYLPEGSLQKLRSARVARVEESQLRPVRQANLHDFQSSGLLAESQQHPSFRSISPKRPTALIAERGQEVEAQQQIQLLEAALNSQFEDVKPGELPKVFIAPTHVPPPPGYVKIPLLPSQNSVQSRSSLPRTFLTSEFHSSLPKGFVQLLLPENVAHLSHDIPFVHPDSNPLLLAHFSPASTLKNSLTNQRQPSDRPSLSQTPTQEVAQFPSSIKTSNHFSAPTHDFNHFQPQVTESNQFQAPIRQFNNFPTNIPEPNQIRVAPSSLLRQPDTRQPQASFDDQSSQRQNFGQQPVATSFGFTDSNFNFNEGFGNQNLDSIPSHAENQKETNIEFTSDPFIQPNELNVQQQSTPVHETDKQSPHRFQIGTPVVFSTDTFPDDQPIVSDSGFSNHFNEDKFGFQEEKLNVFEAPQQLPNKRLRPRPVSNEPQLINEPVTQSFQIADESHFLTTDPTIVEFEETNKSLKPLHENPLEEENVEDSSNFRLSPKLALTAPVSESPAVTDELEHQQTTEQLPELSLSTVPLTEEKELEKPVQHELPVGARNRGRKRLRPNGARGKGRHLNRNRFNNIIPNEEQNKETLPFTTIIPQEVQSDNLANDAITSTSARLPNTRSRTPARRPRPNQQRVAPSKPEAVESAAPAEETTLFPPFSVARQQSNLDEEGVTAEVAPTLRKDTLLRGRFGSRVRSRIQDPNEETSIDESGKSENSITEETVPATRGRNQAAREQAGVRNAGRPTPEWLKNRRRTRVLSRVRKVDPSESTSPDTVSETQELLAGETDLKGAESARVSISQAFGETNEQALNNNEKFKFDTKAKLEKIQTENTESAQSITTIPPVEETETTTENKFDELLEILHLDSATEETPLEIATVKFLNEKENLPVVELQEDISEPNADEGYVDYVSSQSSPVDIDRFSQNRNELERSSRTDKLEESTSSPSMDKVVDFVSLSSSNFKPQISSSFVESRSVSSDVSQNFESKDAEVEDTSDNYFKNFFDVSSTDEKPRLPSKLNDGENLTGSSAHIVYAVALNEAPKENSLSDTSKPDRLLNSKVATEPLDRIELTTMEVNVETTTVFSNEERNTEPEETTELADNANESIHSTPIFQSPSNASTLNFLESFFANKSRPSASQDNEVHDLKVNEGQTVIGSSTVTEVRSSAPVICFSEGNCVIGSGLRKKRNS